VSFRFGLLNAWLACLPILIVGIGVVAARRDVAKRLAEMTGYTPRERACTVAASVAPYPFMLLSILVPFTAHRALLVAGLVLYAAGLALYVAAFVTFMRSAGTAVIDTGVYRLSRNPIYVAASLMFVGIVAATANLVLLGLELAGLVVQHFMILAEERACAARFGASYDEYRRKVARYLGR
jgi:protein-S-isoprenylcysteine O-methyltransferase Ste14